MDIFLAVAVGLLTFVMGYMGVHVTLHPPGDQAKRRWKIAFLMVAVVAIVLTGIQAFMAHQSAAALEAAIRMESERTPSEIQKEAGRPIIVQPQITLRSPVPVDSGNQNKQIPLKHRTLLLANRIEKFFNATVNSYSSAGPVNAVEVTKAQQEILNTSRKQFDQQFSKEVAAIIQESKSKGLATDRAENLSKSTSFYLGYPYEIVSELRHLADQIDMNGHLVR